MVRKFVLILGIVFSLAVLNLVLAEDTSSQQAPAAPETQVPAAPETQGPLPSSSPEAPAEPEMQWLWGEAVSVDLQSNQVVVRYQDYDTEQEKEMAVASDDKTTFENVKSLAEIQPKDILSIDYKTVAEGRSVAKNISVEKAEAPESVYNAVNETPAAESSPELTPAPETAPSSETSMQTPLGVPEATPAQP